MAFSPKQRSLWRGTVQNFHRWNVSVGAVRSGKTYLDYFRIPYRIRNADRGGQILLIGNTTASLERNILAPMRNIWGCELVSVIGEGGKIRLFGRDCWAMGADNASTTRKIQGMSLSYCYGDEVTTWCRTVFEMLKSRLDRAGACFDGTCNPDAPTHWFKVFLDSGADVCVTHFELDDNPFLDATFVKNLKKEYAGTVLYDRYILGRWVAAEGAVYRQFADCPMRFTVGSESVPEIIFATVGVDFGGNESAHAFCLTGYTAGFKTAVILDEYYNKGVISPSRLEEDFIQFIIRAQEKYICTDVYCDSAEQTLIEGLRAALYRENICASVHNARKGRILDRIRLFLLMMSRGQLMISSRCVRTIEAFSTAVWDDKAGLLRLDNGFSNIDSLDAAEYSAEPFMSELIEAGYPLSAK